jgi:hypothetical protein
MTPRGVVLIACVLAVALLGGGLKASGLVVDDDGHSATAATSSSTSTSTTHRPSSHAATTATPAAPAPSTPAIALQPIVAEQLPSSADAAVRAFAQQWINWRASTAVDGFRRLAGLAAYQAQQAALDRARQLQAQDAGATARANEGQLQTVRDRGRGRFVVVTREQASAAGAPVGPERFIAYLAVAQHTPRGWQITTWKEQQ